MEKNERSVQVKFGSMSNFSHYCSYMETQKGNWKKGWREKNERESEILDIL